MWNWLERRVQRQNELDRGVDADLIRDNRKRFRLSWWSFSLGALLVAIDVLVQLPNWFHKTIYFLAFGFLVSGWLAWRWAVAEDAFLNRPDSKEPPKLFKL